MKKMFEVIKNQRGSSTGDTIWGIVVFGLIIWGVLAGLGALIGGESEGVVKYDDCRQIINIKQDSLDTWGKKFTCNDYESKSGRLISGTCVHIDTSGGACVTAYVYEKKSEFNCGANSNPNYDDSVYACSCNDGYHVDPKNNTKCLLGYPSDTPTPTTDTIPSNNDEIATQKELEPVINSNNNPSLSVRVNKLVGNYAVGTIGNGFSGSVWYAVKVDGQWKEVWTGQNIISCKPVQQYNIPKQIYVGPDGNSECSSNY